MNRWLHSLAICIFASSSCSFAVEPWADPDLPKIEGLRLWLDASRLVATAGGENGRNSAVGETVAIFKDASGVGNDAIQLDETSQPKLLRMGANEVPAGTLETADTRRVLRFDGKDDHLRIAEFNQKFNSLTIFIVAAPQSNSGAIEA